MYVPETTVIRKRLFNRAAGRKGNENDFYHEAGKDEFQHELEGGGEGEHHRGN